MSRSSDDYKDQAREQAQKLVRRAAKDGKLSGEDFKDAYSRSLGGLMGPGTNSTYMANAIAGAVRRNPDLEIGKGATDYTGVKRTKGGQLTHEAQKRDPEGFQSFLYPDKGSPKWVQNSRGSYTYIGDLSPRAAKDPAADGPPEPSDTPDAPRDPFAGLTEAPAEGDSAARSFSGGGYGGTGSIHFNPGEDMIAATAAYGNAATDDYFNRFLPEAYDAANLQAREVGAAGAFHLDRFVGKVADLGDPKKLFNYYKNKVS
jgi:hypothetical protein